MYEYKIREVVKVVDGDTVDVILDLGFDMFKKERIRLNGIDAPESRTLDTEEKALGIDAKEFLERRLEDCDNLWVATEKDGKYGRMLGDIWCSATNINEEMVLRGYAWKYDGGTKTKDIKKLKEIRRLV
jgi:micrococcal nuclease